MSMMRLVGVVMLVLTLTGRAAADTVRLTNGDVMTGEIVEVVDDEVVLDGDLFDETRIDVEDIAHIETSRPMVVQYDDGSEATGYVVVDNDRMVLRADPPQEGRTDPVPDVPDAPVVALDEIFKIEPAETYLRYEAAIDVGINASTGNTEQSSFNVAGMFAPSFGKNTVRFSGQLNRSEADGETTASNWRTEASYEREFTPRWRVIGLNRYQHDKFQDLDLRITAAAGPGYTILLDNPSLDVFLAPAYVHESFKEDPTRDYVALMWRLQSEYDLPKPDVTLYHHHSLTVGLSESQTILLTTTGLKWALIGDLDLKLEYEIDWNSNPADDADAVDQRYFLKLSYDFAGDENDWFH